MQWRLLNSSTGGSGESGARNMAVDEAVLAEVEAGLSPPTLRLYGWSPPCISLGHSQRPEEELDLRRVRELGYDVVIRATGGRAVLHIDELTYSVIAPPWAESWCGSRESSYRIISQAVARALAADGTGISLDRGYPVEKPRALRAMTPCFSSTARSEVVWGDRKLVGSAQRRLRDAYLQHGSILVTRGHRNMVECLNLGEEKRARYLEILDRNAVSLEEATGRPVSWSDLARGFGERMAEAMGIGFVRAGLTAAEAGRAAVLTAEKERFIRELPSGERQAPDGSRSADGDPTAGDGPATARPRTAAEAAGR